MSDLSNPIEVTEDTPPTYEELRADLYARITALIREFDTLLTDPATPVSLSDEMTNDTLERFDEAVPELPFNASPWDVTNSVARLLFGSKEPLDEERNLPEGEYGDADYAFRIARLYLIEARNSGVVEFLHAAAVCGAIYLKGKEKRRSVKQAA